MNNNPASECGERNRGSSIIRVFSAFIRFPLFLVPFLFLTHANAQFSSIMCTVNSGVPPVIRAEGFTERVSDLLIYCTGGNPVLPTSVKITLFLNTNVGSRGGAGTETEALLMVDEAGLLPFLPDFVPTPATYRAVRGESSNTLVWENVLFTPTGLGSIRTMRITNVRANAAGLGVSNTLIPTQVVAFVSIAPAGALPINNPQQVVGYVQRGLLSDTADCTGSTVLPAGASGACSGQNNSGNRNLLTGNSGNILFSLRFREGFQSAFAPQVDSEQISSLPGYSYHSESGFIRTSLFGYEVGLASQGTRLHAKFTSLPAGMRVFVATTASAGTTAGASAVLIDAGGGYTGGALIPRVPTPVPATHTLYCAGSATGVGAVEVTGGEAIWEVTAASPAINDTVAFGVAFAYSGSTSAVGQAQIHPSFGPSFATDGASAPDPLAPIPRFQLAVGSPLPAYNNFGGLSVSPAVLPRGATTPVTISVTEPGCLSAVTALSFTTPGITVSGIAPVNATTWSSSVTVPANAPAGPVTASITTSAGTIPYGFTIPPLPTYSILGRITSEGVGIPYAIVTLSPSSGAASSQVNTDTSGNYSFTNVAGGDSYTITAWTPGVPLTPSQIVIPTLQANYTGANFTAALPPGSPANPVPAATATGVARNTILRWAYGGRATSHDVYFGTSAAPPFATNTIADTYNPGLLASNTTYYWRVVARNMVGSTSSPTWSFTTGASMARTLIWQDMTTRQAVVWQMGGAQGGVMQSWLWVAPNNIPGWAIVARADLNNDGTNDLIWQNDATRQVSVWYLGGPQGDLFLNSDWISSAPVPGWRVAAAADVNSDGKPDLIWQDDATGQVSVWFMSGAKGNIFQSWVWLNSMLLPEWRLAAVADLDANGKPDLIWQHITTRQVSYWLMTGAQGNTVAGTGWISADAVPGWRVVGAADVNADTRIDLVWQNDATQQASVWYMGGVQGTTRVFSGWIAEGGVNGWRLTP